MALVSVRRSLQRLLGLVARLRIIAQRRRRGRLLHERQAALRAELQAWKERWFAVASAALKESSPEVYAWLFSNPAQSADAPLVDSVGIFVQRLDQLATEWPLRRDGFVAYERLVAQGLAPEIVQRAKVLHAQLGGCEAGSPRRNASSARTMREDAYSTPGPIE
jgi:hypothetical protein